MRSLAKILLPIDFSDRSVGAARYAKALADRFQSELTLLHVLTPPHYEFGALEIGGSMLTELYRNRSAQVGGELEAFLAAELAGLKVKRVVLEGDPAKSIVEYAASEGANMIIMPTHGYGPFRRFILGSITAKVLHDADCPVWTGVHLEEAPAVAEVPFRHVMCGVDLGPQSCRALEWASWLQREFSARLTLVHAITAAPDTGDTSEVDWRVDVSAAAEEELRSLRERTGGSAEVIVETGDPPHTICSAAERLKADVLVIARGSAAGHFGRLRTNAYAIIRQSPCPVVSV
jgi:nucleotide-binding universal stress UspA family protein